ncbi:hypothetical protein Taro_023419 [Colocasia esculenta]|uniref:Uncharacterized protein n=1 Tax=Colocasia esculenta TaxID=4460 RepID=A0A843V4L5_COLES|nr:hypothetical protein [Colocasia esculenta]
MTDLNRCFGSKIYMIKVDQELEQLGRIYREERSQTGARNITLTRPVDRHGSAVDRGWFPEPDVKLCVHLSTAISHCGGTHFEDWIWKGKVLKEYYWKRRLPPRELSPENSREHPRTPPQLLQYQCSNLTLGLAPHAPQLPHTNHAMSETLVAPYIAWDWGSSRGTREGSWPETKSPELFLSIKAQQQMAMVKNTDDEVLLQQKSLGKIGLKLWDRTPTIGTSNNQSQFESLERLTNLFMGKKHSRLPKFRKGRRFDAYVDGQRRLGCS